MTASLLASPFLLPGLVLMAAPPAVNQSGAVLRDSCSSDATAIVRLAAGTEVRIQFAFSGDIGTCYKVEAAGRKGYVLASELDGLEDYESARARASDRGVMQMIRAEIGKMKEEAGMAPAPGAAQPGSLQLSGRATPAIASAIRMLDANQPRQALDTLESEILRGNRRDPFLLSLAGLAAFQSDEPRKAVDFWSDSLALKPNPSIEALMKKAQRELSADTSRSKVFGDRFLLRYDDNELSRDTASRLMDILNGEYRRIDAGLGCNIQEKITAVVMPRESYQAATGAAEWSGGQFDGRIRVVMPRGGVDAQVKMTLAHELVHACLASQGRFPGWFHEGMAQRWSGESAGAAERAEVRARLRARKMPSLNNLSATFSQMSAQHAALAYAYAWEAVDALYRIHGDQTVRNLIRDPDSLPAVADQLTQALTN